MTPEMIFTATEAIGFSYGVTWNTVRRNIFNWKQRTGGQPGSQGQEPSAMCHMSLRFLKDFILFAEKEEELQKFILRQHQTTAVDKVVARALDPKRTSRTGLAHARERQDLHDDQSRRASVQSERGTEADDSSDDRPQRTRGSDAEESRIGRSGECRARRSNIERSTSYSTRRDRITAESSSR